jgi:hypothetical protein
VDNVVEEGIVKGVGGLIMELPPLSLDSSSTTFMCKALKSSAVGAGGASE